MCVCVCLCLTCVPISFIIAIIANILNYYIDRFGCMRICAAIFVSRRIMSAAWVKTVLSLCISLTVRIVDVPIFTKDDDSIRQHNEILIYTRCNANHRVER